MLIKYRSCDNSNSSEIKNWYDLWIIQDLQMLRQLQEK